MLRGQHQGQLIAGVGNDLQQLVELTRQLATNDRQIDLTVGNAPAGAAGAVHLQLHRHLGVLLTEQTDHPRHQIGARGLARPHDQRAPFEVVQVLEGPAGLLALAQDPIAVAQQQVSGLGQLGLATTPIKQGNIELLLQVLDLQRDRRLGDVEAVGGLLKAALAGDRSQDAQLIKSERQISHGGRCGSAGDQNSRSSGQLVHALGENRLDPKQPGS